MNSFPQSAHTRYAFCVWQQQLFCNAVNSVTKLLRRFFDFYIDIVSEYVYDIDTDTMSECIVTDDACLGDRQRHFAGHRRDKEKACGERCQDGTHQPDSRRGRTPEQLVGHRRLGKRILSVTAENAVKNGRCIRKLREPLTIPCRA